MTSWLDTILSLFIHTVFDGIYNCWTNACHLLALSNIQYLDFLCSNHDTDILYAGSRETAVLYADGHYTA